MWLHNAVKQNYKMNTKGKSPTQIQKDLAAKGVKGFVINVSKRKVTMLVSESYIKRNRECVKNANVRR